jgi:hypothetical protein
VPWISISRLPTRGNRDIENPSPPAVTAGGCTVLGVQVDADDFCIRPEKLKVSNREADVAAEVEHSRRADLFRRNVELLDECLVEDLVIRRARPEMHLATQRVYVPRNHRSRGRDGRRARADTALRIRTEWLCSIAASRASRSSALRCACA